MAATKRKRRGTVRVPIIPTVIAILPELAVGVAAANDAENGATGGEVGAKAMNRLGALYGQAPATSTVVAGVTLNFDPTINAEAKIGGLLTHLLARWAGMTIPLGKRFSLL